MKSLVEWSRDPAASKTLAVNGISQSLKNRTATEKPDAAIELLKDLIENISTSSQLVQLVSGTQIIYAKLDQLHAELQQSLQEFDKKFSAQTQALLLTVVLPWLRGKVTEKAVEDICSEFGELAKSQKLDAMLFSAPSELRPILQQRLSLSMATPMEESPEIAIQFGSSRIQTDIELWLEKFKGLLLI